MPKFWSKLKKEKTLIKIYISYITQASEYFSKTFEDTVIVLKDHLCLQHTWTPAFCQKLGRSFTTPLVILPSLHTDLQMRRPACWSWNSLSWWWREFKTFIAGT